MPKKINRPMPRPQMPMGGGGGMRPPMGGNPMMGMRPLGMSGMPQRPPMGGGQPQGQREPMVPLSVANKMVVDALQAANGKAQPRPPQR